ncbi:MAG: hypothetical protein V4660_17050 [Pseudomonadota bacterium]
MAIANAFQRGFNRFFILGLVATLTACGGGGGSSKKTTPTPASSAAVSSSSSNTSSSNLNTSSTMTSSLSSSTLASSASSSSSIAFLMGGAIQRGPLNIATVVTTLAGVPWVANGTGVSANFNHPNGIVSDGTNLYVTDPYGDTIRKIVIATNEVTTLAGSPNYDNDNGTDGTGAMARFNDPYGIAIVGANLYVTDDVDHTIRKIVIATGEVTTIAGVAGSWGSSDGIGATARFENPRGITTDGANLFVADMHNSTIRKIVVATGEVSTIAGTASSTGGVDGTGAAARFNWPMGITNDGANLYVADTLNNTIRKIVIATGAVTTLAGAPGVKGSADSIGTAASFYFPIGIVINGPHLYVVDSENQTIRKIVTATGSVTTFAGRAGLQSSIDGTGAAAGFFSPVFITNHEGNLYVTEKDTVRKIVITTGAVTTFAGAPDNADGTGAAARFFSPLGTTTDGTNLYVADGDAHTVRKIVIATGAVTTFAGTAGIRGSTDATGAAARFSAPQGITNDGTYLYVTDAENYLIRKISMANGTVTTVAGLAGINGSVDGIGSAARFDFPLGITTDGINLYIADRDNQIIRKVVIASGEVTTIAGTADMTGATDGTGASARFSDPSGITTEGTNLYITDNRTIRKMAIASGVVTTLAGLAATSGSADGVGAVARFRYPTGIITDGTNLYVADQHNHTIRKVVIATGLVTTLAGTAGIIGSTDGTGTTANLRYPVDITTDGYSLFVTDAGNSTVRKIQ